MNAVSSKVNLELTPFTPIWTSARFWS